MRFGLRSSLGEVQVRRPRKIIEQTIIMCVPTLRQSSYRLLCCLASLQSKIYHCRSVEMLQRSMVVYSGREDLDNTVPPPWERIRSVPASMERHSQTPLVSFRPEKQKGRVPDCCTSSTGADRKPTPPRDINTSQGLSASSVEKIS